MGEDIIGEGVLWDLLLVSGYLRPRNTRIVEGRTRCELKVPDIMIIPKDASKKGVVIEFKTLRSDKGKTLEENAQRALEQIAAIDYADELASYDIKEAVKLAIVFCGKKVYMGYNVRKVE
ncbi:PD-(D/E)XK nuclease domain-containing protein [Mahella australiensis]|uniref:PD-(D/E)XK nuclease domain-containing protein n=1 Tax=Mahella australiensis TaxID=252966 RepID=UPI0002F9A3C9|nr:PD-(D/E)XK nuclease domain-containing protein [Mahella australiensis]